MCHNWHWVFLQKHSKKIENYKCVFYPALIDSGKKIKWKHFFFIFCPVILDSFYRQKAYIYLQQVFFSMPDFHRSTLQKNYRIHWFENNFLINRKLIQKVLIYFKVWYAIRKNNMLCNLGTWMKSQQRKRLSVIIILKLREAEKMTPGIWD